MVTGEAIPRSIAAAAVGSIGIIERVVVLALQDRVRLAVGGRRDGLADAILDAAVAGGLVPDLRYSGALGSAEAVKSVVIDGALKHNGMVSFSSALKPADVEAIRQYVIKRANEDKALGD